MATPTPPGPTTRAPSSGKGVAALVLGVLSIPLGLVLAPLGLILGIVAIVLGALGRKESRAMGEAADGKATGGLVTGVLGSVIAIVVMAFFGYVFSQYGDDIEACSKEPTEAARQACIDQRVNQDQ